MKNILFKDGEALYLPHFFSTEESDAFLQKLLTEIKWEQTPIKVFGKEVMQPRLTAWYGDSDKTYRYSGTTMHPFHWTETLLTIKSRIEPLANVSFTSVLLNLYRDEKDSMGWHRDNEKELGPNPVIASLSLGAVRQFHFKHIKEKGLSTSLDLEDGSLLLMRGETQSNWYHSLPKLKGPAGVRINLTFRTILDK